MEGEESEKEGECVRGLGIGEVRGGGRQGDGGG